MSFGGSYLEFLLDAKQNTKKQQLKNKTQNKNKH